jgi:transcription initiation factor TFIIB
MSHLAFKSTEKVSYIKTSKLTTEFESSDRTSESTSESTSDHTSEEIDWDCFKQWKEFDDSDEEKKGEDYIKKSDIKTDIYSCKSCKATALVYKDGSNICSKCGVVQNKEYSSEAEYRFYGENDNKGSNPERVGMPTSDFFPESSLGSMMGNRGMDACFRKLAQCNSWNSMPYKEHSLWEVCKNIATIAKMHDLPNIIVERAKDIYRKIREINISRGTNRKALEAACLSMACKDEGVPRSNKEIAAMFKLKTSDMTRGIKKFRDVWRRCNVSEYEKINFDSSNPLHYIERFCSNLMLGDDIRYIAEYVAVRAMQMGLVNDNTSPSIAAGAIYITCLSLKKPISKTAISEKCLVSTVTLIKIGNNKLMPYKANLLPTSVKEKYGIKSD